MQSTAFPQNGFAMCKTCEEQFFFLRKTNTDNNLLYVEKKFCETQLICLLVPQ